VKRVGRSLGYDLPEMTMDESSSSESKFRDSGVDWALRGLVFLLFIFFGGGKFRTSSNGPWIDLYKRIGFGQWFLYATGIIELAGAFLTLVPQTVSAGLILLGTTMVGAVLIDVIILRQIADASVPFAILCALIAFWMRRRRG
jgi:putative oxidoreductase